MDAVHNLTAVFSEVPPTMFDLTVGVEGSGVVVPGVGVHSYLNGSVVDVSASAGSGWVFSHWVFDGVVVSGSVSPWQVSMDAVHNLTAVFSEVPPTMFDLTVGVEGSGVVVPGVGVHSYLNGSVVDVSASGGSGWVLSRWVFDGVVVSGSVSPWQVSMDAVHNLTAVFSEVPP